MKIRDGSDGSESFPLCRSASRSEKEKATHERFSQRIEEELHSVDRRIEKSHTALARGVLERRMGAVETKLSRRGARLDRAAELTPRPRQLSSTGPYATDRGNQGFTTLGSAAPFILAV